MAESCGTAIKNNTEICKNNQSGLFNKLSILLDVLSDTMNRITARRLCKLLYCSFKFLWIMPMRIMRKNDIKGAVRTAL